MGNSDNCTNGKVIMRPFDSRTYVCGPFEKTEKARPQCGRHATHSDITSHGIKSPSSPTVPTRLSAADHAPLLGEHVAGPYSNRVLSPHSLLPAGPLALLSSINTSHLALGNIDTNETILTMRLPCFVPDFMLYTYSTER